MNELTRIICPLDFSEPSMHAFDLAIRLGRTFRLPIALVHVVVPIPAYSSAPEAMVVYPAPFQDAAAREEAALQQLRTLRRQVEAAGLLASIQVLHGPAGRTIVELVRESPSSLLVLGTHGYRGFQRFVLGSTTAEVLRRAPCPVLTVREQQGEGPIERIGVGVDFSAACEPAIELAARWARTFNAELHLVHVMRPIEVPMSAETHIPLYVTQVGEATQVAAVRELEEIASRIQGVTVKPAVVAGENAWRELVQYAHDTRLDLLALGTHGRTGLRRLFLGSVAERALQLSSCPVLSVKLPAEVPAELSWREVAEDLKLRRAE